MKLLLEQFDEVNVLTESVGGEKKLYIEGVFAQAEKKNRNGRIYPKHVLESQINKYIVDKVNTRRALGELNHPSRPNVDAKEACHRIVEMRWDGNDVYGKAIILNTPNGNIVRGLLDGGTSIGVSTRGAGSVKLKNGINEVQKDYQMTAIDAVTDPSGIDCFVESLMESADWVYQNGIWTPSQLEESKQIIKSASKEKLLEAKFQVFTKMLGNLNSNK